MGILRKFRRKRSTPTSKETAWAAALSGEAPGNDRTTVKGTCMPTMMDEQKGLDVAVVHELLQQQGYGMVCRFGHMHATTGIWEWHICLVADLASMTQERFLLCLDEAIKQSIEHLLPPLS